MEELSIKNYSGWFYAKSAFFSARGAFDELSFDFKSGINVLKGDIDSGNFGISYGISMRKYDKGALLLDPESKEYVDGVLCDLKDYSNDICYIDDSYPLFKRQLKRKFNNIVKKKYKNRLEELGISIEMLYETFGLDIQRGSRPLLYTGNMKYRFMVAMGYLEGKTVFCFPWTSKMQFERWFYILDAMETLNLIVILPTNYGGFGDKYKVFEM